MFKLNANLPSGIAFSARKNFTVRAKNLKISLGQKTKIMGTLNLTPDSFSQDGCYKDGKVDINRNVEIALKLIRDGADIIDIGGESTRPGARKIPEKEEISRTIPTLKKLSKKTKKPISIDSYKPKVIKNALDSGACIINNIMGTKLDKTVLKMVKNYNCAIVLMHIRGTPRTMQKNIKYKNLIYEIIEELQKSIEKCLEIGIKSDKIIIDPGIGFGKTATQNLEIIQNLPEFRILNQPILIGTSRKSFIGKVLQKDVADRLMGTAATVCTAILKGAHIVRVHDVKEMHDVVKTTDAILSS